MVSKLFWGGLLGSYWQHEESSIWVVVCGILFFFFFLASFYDAFFFFPLLFVVRFCSFNWSKISHASTKDFTCCTAD